MAMRDAAARDTIQPIARFSLCLSWEFCSPPVLMSSLEFLIISNFSIHAPTAREAMRAKSFNPRPRAGGDSAAISEMACLEVSIHAPAREATRHPHARCGCESGFNPRPPRGGRPSPRVVIAGVTGFNPRPPRGGRQRGAGAGVHLLLFQSTPPAWGATTGTRSKSMNQSVSIHAPRVGGDVWNRPAVPRPGCFNPRPPRGGRLAVSRPN